MEDEPEDSAEDEPPHEKLADDAKHQEAMREAVQGLEKQEIEDAEIEDLDSVAAMPMRPDRFKRRRPRSDDEASISSATSEHLSISSKPRSQPPPSAPPSPSGAEDDDRAAPLPAPAAAESHAAARPANAMEEVEAAMAEATVKRVRVAEPSNQATAEAEAAEMMAEVVVDEAARAGKRPKAAAAMKQEEVEGEERKSSAPDVLSPSAIVAALRAPMPNVLKYLCEERKAMGAVISEQALNEATPQPHRSAWAPRTTLSSFISTAYRWMLTKQNSLRHLHHSALYRTR